VNLSWIIFAIWSQPAGAGPELKGDGLLGFLLLSVLAVALLLGMICMFVVLRFRRCQGREPGRSESLSNLAVKPKLLLFDSPGRWLAIRSNSPESVQSALGLHNATLASWEQGLAEAQDLKLFLTPPIKGWILVLGIGLPEPADDIDELFHLIVALSRALGEVQFFSANRVVDSHAWVHANHGRILRAYAWSGATLWNQGVMTGPETELGLTCFDYTEPARQKFSSHEPQRTNAEKVPLLAGRWSIDPTSLDESAIDQRLGIVGSLSFPKPH
jgi:hypothetical protein